MALHRRCEARRDGLKLLAASVHLHITWRAREIHPWDAGKDQERSSDRFVHQLLEDTEVATQRLFSALPHVDTITAQVLRPDSDQVLVSGTLDRQQERSDSPSTRFRLMARGLRVEI